MPPLLAGVSPFLDGVRLIAVPSHGVLPRADADSPSPGEASIQADPKTGSVNVHKHSSDGDSAFIAVPIVAIVFTFIYLIVKAVMAPFNNRSRHAPPMSSGGGLTEEEVAVLQKLQRTLVQMESRVESLETILIEQSRTEKKYGSKL